MQNNDVLSAIEKVYAPTIIREATARLAQEVQKQYQGPLRLLCVLKSGIIFFADFMRELTVEVRCEYVGDTEVILSGDVLVIDAWIRDHAAHQALMCSIPSARSVALIGPADFYAFPRIQKVQARAPIRIDLAGGTLDMWPLHLFLTEPVTCNVAIGMYAETILSAELAAPSWTLNGEVFDKIPQDQGLITQALKYLAQRLDCTQLAIVLETKAESPIGAGLGGSSALAITLIAACDALVQKFQGGVLLSHAELVATVRDLETRVIAVPAGEQDYWSACKGGGSELVWCPGGVQHRALPHHIIQGFLDRSRLYYSGVSRNSGINNWLLFQDCINQKNDVRACLQQISDNTHTLIQCLLQEDWWGVLAAIRQEMKLRCMLASTMTTPELDAAFMRAESLLPGVAVKICGAGGGGCFFLFHPEMKDLDLKLRQLPLGSVSDGLRVC